MFYIDENPRKTARVVMGVNIRCYIVKRLIKYENYQRIESRARSAPEEK